MSGLSQMKYTHTPQPRRLLAIYLCLADARPQFTLTNVQEQDTQLWLRRSGFQTELITKRCCSADGWLLESELWRLINELLGGVSGTQRAPCVKQAGKDNLGKLNRLKGMREYRTKECERMLMHGRALWLHNAAIKRFSVTSLNEKCGFIIGRVSVAMMSEKKHRNERSGSHLPT